MHSELNFITAQTKNTLAAAGGQNLAQRVKIADAKMERAAKDFEAVFLSEMMKPMFDGLKSDGMFGGGHAEEIFRSVMIQEYGKMVADTGRVGIADHVRDAMIKLQEQQTKASSSQPSDEPKGYVQ